MVKPALRSRSLRRVKRKVPGGRVSMQYKERKVGKPACGKCGDALLGMAHGTLSRVRKHKLSGRRPSRPYGGMLCSACARDAHVAKARASS